MIAPNVLLEIKKFTEDDIDLRCMMKSPAFAYCKNF
jgi:hypothetical protein